MIAEASHELPFIASLIASAWEDDEERARDPRRRHVEASRFTWECEVMDFDERSVAVSFTVALGRACTVSAMLDGERFELVALNYGGEEHIDSGDFGPIAESLLEEADEQAVKEWDADADDRRYG